MNFPDPSEEAELIQSWELALLAKVVLAFRTDNRDDLAGDLAKRLAELKRRMPPGVRDWRAYLAKFFTTKPRLGAR